jgi:hypothetical protein
MMNLDKGTGKKVKTAGRETLTPQTISRKRLLHGGRKRRANTRRDRSGHYLSNRNRRAFVDKYFELF